MSFQNNKIDKEIVESARIFGQWLNKIAFNFAKNEVGNTSNNSKEKIKKLKARILKQIELDTINAQTPQDMIYHVYLRLNNPFREDVPASATRFLDAVNSGEEISFTQSRKLLITYMHVRNDN